MLIRFLLLILMGMPSSFFVMGIVRTLSIEYTNDLDGHYAFGHKIGSTFASSFNIVFSTDPELHGLMEYIMTNEGQKIFEALVLTSKVAFPLYFAEITGMSDGAGVNLTVVLVNNFREELCQFASNLLPTLRRVDKCSSAFINYEGTLALGHNDDWTQNWRNLSYWLLANETQANGEIFSFGTWVYPGYLAGMDISFNSHGIIYSVNSLFPKHYERGGIGTAFVARDLLYATSLADAINRASKQDVSTAMSYNLGSTREKRLLQLEVNTGGGSNIASLEIQHGQSYFHGNEFVVLNTSQWPDASTTHRAHRWKQMQPIRDISKMRAFLGDQQTPYPVWRNGPPDSCYTEVTGIFDLYAGTLSVWTGNPLTMQEPEKVFRLF